MNIKNNLTEGPIKKTLVNLSVPMVIAILSTMAFNLIDVYFVGKLGTIQLAALTLTFPVVMTITTFIIGLSVGSLTLISQSIGEDDRQKVARITTDSLSLALMVAFLIIVAGYLSLDKVFILIGATNETLPFVKDYMNIWYGGMIFFVVPMIGNNAIRAAGDTRTPSIIMLIAVLSNAVLDPIFIFGFGPVPSLGLPGAAIASVISKAFTLFCALYILHFKKKILTTPFASMTTIFHSWKQILSIGFPVALSNSLMPLSMGVITNIISVLGPPVVAGFGVATRIESFSFTIIFALSTGLSPFVGQNKGAQKLFRIIKGINYSLYFSLLWGVFLALGFFFWGNPIASLFHNDCDVIRIASLYLLVVPFSYGLKGIHQVIWTALNVLGKPMHSFALEFIHSYLLFIPLAYLGLKQFEIKGVFIAAAIANCLGGIIAWLVLTYDLQKISIKK